MKLKALLLSVLTCLVGCSKSPPTGLESLVAHFERSGVKGPVQVMPPLNEDIASSVTVTIDPGGQGAKMVSFVRCRDEAAASRSYEDALKNPVFSGTSRNGLLLMFCTFVPADEKRAKEMKDIFASYKP